MVILISQAGDVGPSLNIRSMPIIYPNELDVQIAPKLQILQARLLYKLGTGLFLIKSRLNTSSLKKLIMFTLNTSSLKKISYSNQCLLPKDMQSIWVHTLNLFI